MLQICVHPTSQVHSASFSSALCYVSTPTYCTLYLVHVLHFVVQLTPCVVNPTSLFHILYPTIVLRVPIHYTPTIIPVLCITSYTDQVTSSLYFPHSSRFLALGPASFTLYPTSTSYILHNWFHIWHVTSYFPNLVYWPLIILHQMSPDFLPVFHSTCSPILHF